MAANFRFYMKVSSKVDEWTRCQATQHGMSLTLLWPRKEKNYWRFSLEDWPSKTLRLGRDLRESYQGCKTYKMNSGRNQLLLIIYWRKSVSRVLTSLLRPWDSQAGRDNHMLICKELLGRWLYPRLTNRRLRLSLIWTRSSLQSSLRVLTLTLRKFT